MDDKDHVRILWHLKVIRDIIQDLDARLTLLEQEPKSNAGPVEIQNAE